MFLGLAGLLGFVASLVLLIVAVIRRRPKQGAAIALAACFALFIVGVASSPDSADEPPESSESQSESEIASEPSEAESSSESSEEPESEPPQEPAGDEGDIGDYHVAIKGAESGQDYEGSDCIIVTYEWTNNDDSAHSFMIALNATAFQGAVECSRATMVDGVEPEDLLKDIRPGMPVEIKVAYKLNDSETQVEIEVQEQITFADAPPKVARTFELPLPQTEKSTESEPTTEQTSSSVETTAPQIPVTTQSATPVSATQPQTRTERVEPTEPVTYQRESAPQEDFLDLQDAPDTVTTQGSDRTAYWVSGGKSYHFSADCTTLKRSRNIIEGTLSEALADGKTDPCNLCARG